MLLSALLTERVIITINIPFLTTLRLAYYVSIVSHLCNASYNEPTMKYPL